MKEAQPILQTQCAIRKTPPRFSMNPWPAVENVFLWGRYAAFDRTLPPALRVSAWVLVVMWIGFVVGVGVFALMCIGVAFAEDNTSKQMMLWMLMGFVVALYPAWWTRAAIRRKRSTGLAVKLSAESAAEIHANWCEWRAEQYSKSKSEKRSTLLTLIAVIAVWLIAGRYMRGQYLLMAIYVVWCACIATAMFIEPGSSKRQ